MPLLAAYGKPVAVAAIVIVVGYLTLVIGELVPKNVALVSPEVVATRIARPLAWFARAAAPLVFLLDASSRCVLRCLGIRPGPRQTVTEDDIHNLVAEGARVGVIHRVERDMIEGVLDLADRAVRTIMTPRPSVVWVDLDDPRERVVQKIAACPHAQILVCRGSIDEPLGVVRKQDLFDQCAEGRAIDVEQVMHAPLIVPGATSILRTLDLFRKTPVHTALVVNEFGTVRESPRGPICWRLWQATFLRSTRRPSRRSRSARTARCWSMAQSRSATSRGCSRCASLPLEIS